MSAGSASISFMRAVRSSAHFLAGLLLVLVELALFPVRLVGMLLGAVLLIVGLLGLPVWLVQLVASIAGGSQGAGPLPAWEMCLLLAAAVPAGLVMLLVANPDGASLPVDEPTVAADGWSEPRPLASRDAPSGSNTPPRSGPVALDVRARWTTYAGFVRHGPRFRAASKRIVEPRRRQRGGH